MATPVKAICPDCEQEVVVDPLGSVWPAHRQPFPMQGHDCPHSGKPMPHQREVGGTLRVVGTPVITLKEEQLASMTQGEPSTQVGIRYVDNQVNIDFPTTGSIPRDEEGVTCVVRRDDAPPEGAVIVARFGSGFLAPKITVLVEYPTLSTFSTPEEADEWMERML